MTPQRARPWLWLMSALVIMSTLVSLARQCGRELASPLFRDAAMMQYTGWCIRHGMRLYADVGSPDGPVIHFLHAAMQLLGGITDAGTRRVDLALQIAGGTAMGWLLAPPSAEAARRVGVRVLWSVLGVVAWLCWYLTGGWEHTVQRDPYYALLGYLALVLLYASARFTPARAHIAIVVAGALLAWEPFTRQSGAIYPAMGVFLLLLDDPTTISPRRRLRWLVLGAVVGLVVLLTALLVWGSLPGFVWWYFRFPLDAYRYIAQRPFLYLFTRAYRPQQWLVLLLAANSLGLVYLRILPRRALVFALTAFLFLVAACLMGKGWANHVQQVTAAANVTMLVLVSELWMRADVDPGEHGLRVGAVVLALAVLQIRLLSELQGSPFAARLAVYDESERDAATLGRWLAERTGPDDRVFYFASEAHGLLYAERKTAIPYFVDTIFDLRHFLQRQPPSPGITIPPAALDRFNALQDEIARDGCGRVAANPPAAVVVRPHDLKTWSTDTLLGDVGALCPGVPIMLAVGYTQVQLGGYQVFFRR